MKIQVLIEDTPVDGFCTEHGLSLLIESEDGTVLLDAGSTSAFMENAKNMGAEISNVMCSVLSHGHYDHSGGYDAYLAQNEGINVYAMRSSDGAYFSGTGGVIHYVGIPERVLEQAGDRFQYIDAVTKLGEHIYLIPDCTEGLERSGARAALYKKEEEGLRPDDFAHELSLVYDTPKGFVIFNSCSHAGIKSIIEEVKRHFPEKKIYAFVGGLHMKGKVDGKEVCIFTEEEVADMAAYVKTAGIQKLYTGHCTGMVAFKMLERYLGSRIEKLNTGDVIEL